MPHKKKSRSSNRTPQVVTAAAKGGLARSAALTPENRTAIARMAAVERWAKAGNVPKETHSGVLALGDGLPCSVLSNGMRVFSVNGLLRAFGSGAKGRVVVDYATPPIPGFLSAANVRRFISDDLMARLSKPVTYRSKGGGRPAHGYEAEILHKICETLLDARASGLLRQPQARVAEAAELLMRGFARVGLVALIDEATGYQADRAQGTSWKQNSEVYISKESPSVDVHKFPNDFFEQVYRLHGWAYKAGNAKRPQYVGKIINKYVYAQLPDGVPRGAAHKKNHSHQQEAATQTFFNFSLEDTGNPHLDRQIIIASDDDHEAVNGEEEDFVAKFKKAVPAQWGIRST